VAITAGPLLDYSALPQPVSLADWVDDPDNRPATEALDLSASLVFDDIAKEALNKAPSGCLNSLLVRLAALSEAAPHRALTTPEVAAAVKEVVGYDPSRALGRILPGP